MKYHGGISIIKYLFNCLLEVIYPRNYKCISCGGEIEENVLCKKCLEKSREVNYSYEILNLKEIYSCNYYSQAMRMLVINYKEKRNFEVGEYFVKLLNEKIQKENITFDIVTFVPSNKNTIKRRGFDHGKYLAKGVAEKFNKQLLDFLYKKDDLGEQKKLTAYNRKENLKNAFGVLEKNLVGKKVLMVDDVLTTGNTLSACSEVIKKYNKVDIIYLTVIKSSI
ncbi:MAG: ComF family protein [Sarcina sp.]